MTSQQEVRGNDAVSVDQTPRKVQTESADNERMERVMGTKMNGGRAGKIKYREINHLDGTG